MARIPQHHDHDHEHGHGDDHARVHKQTQAHARTRGGAGEAHTVGRTSGGVASSVAGTAKRHWGWVEGTLARLNLPRPAGFSRA
eukprot:CAMPEP_0183333114 /NCGR_PEP_ID=MMETSP0164_2-20130417/2088_1 /TAXON_ID=221442 /ORGANISM="Coccolithus pelagicus ssp braarudi, Strain PLY182g" /LENGTH=83 /DNA_ID=CAMNT_0025501953 /DNA_START=261 /DNA_END=512 /DNA_ORIENTATION=+